ncbi:phosphatase PAP2 family protein [Lichenifustis flavocetrariae]|uniref:Phosphatase PAP2 family protein n=1 Tax=Lichenifustis flavocetrariae TaxID=2949735 RepID=A0AA42CJ32_9HYPH|nr:phosphatase PAP2 family protein [Lichenifustis flavocetrariae]MCW6507561.1 phosphatase PAP2 family protein [Lichenifustis flavocetrariae]
MTSRLLLNDQESPSPSRGPEPEARGLERVLASPLGICLVALGLAMPLCSVTAWLLDAPVARLVATAPSSLHGVAQVFSDFGLSGYMLVSSGAIAAGAFWLVRRGGRRQGNVSITALGERALFVFSSVAVSGILVQVIKHVVGRARPKFLETLGPFHFDLFSIKASLASFPSGHTTSIFALAAALCFFKPQLRGPAFLIAVLVGAARIVLGSHYLSDVLAGAILGLATTSCLAAVFAGHSLAFTRGPRGLPRLKHPGDIWAGLGRDGAMPARIVS